MNNNNLLVPGSNSNKDKPNTQVREKYSLKNLAQAPVPT